MKRLAVLVALAIAVGACTSSAIAPTTPATVRPTTIPPPAPHARQLLVAVGPVAEILGGVNPARYPKYISSNELTKALDPQVLTLQRAIQRLDLRGRLATNARSFEAALARIEDELRAGDRASAVLSAGTAAEKGLLKATGGPIISLVSR